jgi:hypothetical protein
MMHYSKGKPPVSANAIYHFGDVIRGAEIVEEGWTVVAKARDRADAIACLKSAYREKLELSRSQKPSCPYYETCDGPLRCTRPS